MILVATLSRYIARVFAFNVLVMLAALSGLVALFDFIELLRRAATRPEATLGIIAEIAALRLPWLAMQVLPFAVLLGSLLAFWRLTRSSELVVARAAGVSAWQFLAAPTLFAVLLGALATMAISPLSAALRARAETVDSAYLKSGGGPLSLNGGQLWLRQADHALDPKGVAILHASGVSLRNGTLSTGPVSVFRLDGNDMLIERLEAQSAVLDHHQWVFAAARVLRPGRATTAPGTLRLPTQMTVDRVQDSFAPPDTLSFWALPGFIRLLDRSGFSSVRHRLRFQALLALPLLAGTMTLMAAGFAMRPSGRGGAAWSIGYGVLTGFLLFMMAKLAEEFGQSGSLPPALAAWGPALAGLLFSLALLLHQEDG